MDKIIISASITLENGFATKKYRWKSDSKKESLYRRPCRRAVLRFTCRNFAYKVNNTKREDRQIEISFAGQNKLILRKIKEKGISLQGYSGKHPYIQIIINKALPNSIWKIFEKSNKKTLTLPVDVEIDLDDWSKFGLSVEDFLLEVEQEAKLLIKKAKEKGFKINYAPKGRSYDARLINQNNKDILIAISSHVAKSKSRSKEKTVQKILIDISKMLPHLEENKKIIPVVITRPIEFENSWSFNTQKYLNFYKNKFNFIFITTDFKKGWEDSIINQLIKT